MEDPDSENTLRIEDLAQLTGLSVRNIRSHHERGLLPPPAVRGRVGFYGSAHVERIRLIQSLQAEGLKLEGIKRLLEESQDAGSGLLRVKHAADAFAEPEASEVVPESELLGRLSVPAEEAGRVLAEAQRLGIVFPLGHGQYQVLSPALIDAAEAVVRGGIQLDSALALVADVADHADVIAKRFISTFLEDVWAPFLAAGMPEQEWSRIGEAIDNMRPAAAQTVLAVFRHKLADDVEATFADVARQLAERDA